MDEFQRVPNQNLIKASMVPINVALALNFTAPFSLFPLIMETYGVNRGEVSLLLASVALTLTLLLIPIGIIVAKIGPAKSLVVGGILMAVGIPICLLPPFWIVTLLRIIYGLGCAFALTGTSAAVIRWCTPAQRPVMNGLNLTAQGLGISFAMFFGPHIAALMGWHYTLSLYAGFSLLSTIPWIVIMRVPALVRTMGVPSSRADILGVLKNKNTILLALAALGPFGIFMGSMSWLPTYYHEVRLMPLEKAGSIVSVMTLTGGIFSFAMGLFVAWLGLRRPLLFMAGVLLPAAGIGAFMVNGEVMIIGVLLLLGLIFSLVSVCIFTIPMEIPGTSQQNVAIVTAAALTTGNLAVTLAPLFIGVTTDIFGSYIPGVVVVAIGSMSVLVVAIFLPETGPRGSIARTSAK